MSKDNNSSKRSKNPDVWRTIDDVNATLDSLSLISGGKPTKTGTALANALSEENINDNLNNFLQNQYPDISCDGYYTVDDPEDGAYGGEDDSQQHLAEWEKQALKDAELQAELAEIFPYSFSNAAIERHFGQNNNEVIKKPSRSIDDEVEDRLRSLTSYCDIQDIKLINEYQVEARACSPPSVELPSCSEQSSESPTPSEKLVEDEKKPMSPIVTKKKCRNALLNSLFKKQLSESSTESDLVLKTPGDFLGSTSVSNESNNCSVGNCDSSHSSKCSSFSCLFKNRSSYQTESNSDSFEYKPEDFPAL